MKTLSVFGENLIKSFERLELCAYPDPISPLGRECTASHLNLTAYRQLPHWPLVSGAPWTIGWGFTGPEVKPGVQWSLGRAQAAFDDVIKRIERDAVDYVADFLNPNQYDAIVSLVYNIGTESFNTSRLHKYIVAGALDKAADEFLRWDHGGGQVVQGLLNRRMAERNLFETPWGDQ